MSSWNSLTFGEFSDSGGTYSLSKATDIEGTSLYAQNGATLSFPAVTTIAGTSDFYVYWQANGTNSQLLLHNLQSITQQSGGDSELYVQADGTGALVDLSSLTVFGVGGSFTATNGGTIELPAGLTSLNGVSLTISGPNSALLEQLKQFTNGTLTLEGGTYTLSKLTDINGSSLYVENGAHLTLPDVSTYTDYNGSYYVYGLTFNTSGGGTLSMPELSSITGYYFTLSATGTDSLINLPALATITSPYSYGEIYLTANSGGTIDLSTSLTALTLVDITIGTDSTINGLGKLTSLTDSSLTVDGAVAVVLFALRYYRHKPVCLRRGHALFARRDEPQRRC